MAGPVTIVVAHPDDETIGVGAQLARWTNVRLVHVTDGAPRTMADAEAAGFETREDYAQARRAELYSALRLAEINPELDSCLGFVDQETAFHLAEIAAVLFQKFVELQPATVITHPYEGGHPDHDSTCFAVHAATALLIAQNQHAPELLELTSYHNEAGRMATNCFLPRPDCPITLFKLTPSQCELKQRMFGCFKTQTRVLEQFGIETEQLRPAPRYDFSQPPHQGKLFYELFNWGVTGHRWRALAQNVVNQMGLHTINPEAGLACMV